MGEIAEILEELKELTDQIQQAKEEKAKKSGQLTEQMKTLKALGAKTSIEGEKVLKKYKKEMLDLKETIIEEMGELKAEYEW
jgi:hypothetical protein